jgi:hypothetical protein
MKLILLFFILLASSTYRCADDVVDCTEAARGMIGQWNGEISYTSPSSANRKKHAFSLIVTSSNECYFEGFTTYSDSNTSFIVSGSIDIYGWVSFIEDDYKNNDGEYAECISYENDNDNTCKTWPDLRWKNGTKFEETRIKNNPDFLNGKIHRPSSFERWYRILRGDYSMSKI